VLLAPYALAFVDVAAASISTTLTKQQIIDNPALDADKPVSQQFETDFYNYYGWPAYWTGPFSWGFYPYLERDKAKWERPAEAVFTGKHRPDWHLRSSLEVIGYHVQAVDGEIGHIVDIIVDNDTWEIRYLVISTSNWWAGKKVLIAPLWVDRVSWEERTVTIDLTRQVIQLSPEYDDSLLVTRDYETNLYGHYNRKGYWVKDFSPEKAGCGCVKH
jgi:hypothetical protein